MRVLRKSRCSTAAVLFFCAATASIVRGEQVDSLRVSWANPDHSSGIYYPRGTGTVTIIIENPTAGSLPLAGSIAFGPHTENAKEFKPLSVTPITPSTLAAGERATVNITLQFANVGAYDLRWITTDQSTLLQNSAGEKLECIFAPRITGETRWLAPLPRQAASIASYLGDFATQTGVHRFLLDERFAFDLEHNVGLAAGASLGASEQQIDAMFQDAAKSHAGILLRVAVPVKDVDPRLFTAFHEYIDNAVRRSSGALQALAILPDSDASTPEQRAIFRRFYLAAYEAAKSRDKSILMLGAGTAQATRELIADQGLIKYVDGLAITDASSQPLAAAALGKLPLWILPPPGGEVPAAAIQLAEDAAVVTIPAPAIDHGATAHLLGGAAFYQKLSPASFPYVAVFQGDGYSVAAVAGQSAGAPLDGIYAELQKSRTTVGAAEDDGKPPYPNFEVADEPGSMRVVDAAGAPVDCRNGDTLYVPAADKIVYVIAGGSAEDLMSILRVAASNRLPVAGLNIAHGDNALTLRLKNITADQLRGKLRILQPDNTVLLEKDLPAVPTQTAIEIPLVNPAEAPKSFTVELTTPSPHGIIQRTVLPTGAP